MTDRHRRRTPLPAWPGGPERADVGLDLHGPDALDGPFAPGVLVLGDPDLTGAVLAATPSTTTVITTLAGYDPALH